MSLSLDTSVLVDLTKGEPAVVARLRRALEAGERVVVSSVVVEEMRLGAAISRDPSREQQKVDQALSAFQWEPFTSEDAERCAEHRSRQWRAGRRLSAYGGLIVGQAFARGWTLVTSDAKLADAVLDVTVQDWRTP